MGNLTSVMTSRRSIRRFSDKPVDSEIIKKIIDLSMWAPSACNRQDWRFIVINDQKIKDKIVEYGGTVIISSSPVIILVLYSNKTNNLEYQDHVQSGAAAIQNLLLAAHDNGLGTCWICNLPIRKNLRKVLNIPKKFDPIALVLLGHPKVIPKEVKRKYEVSQIISYNNFDFPEAEEVTQDSYLWLRRILTYVYKHSPLFIQKNFLNLLIDKKWVKKFDN